jgi:hypothetical protein
MDDLKHQSRFPWPIAAELRIGETWHDVGRDLYWRVRRRLALDAAGETVPRTSAQQHRLALRAAQVGFLKLAFDRSLEEIADVLGISVRTAKRSSALLRRAIGPGPTDQ